MINPVSSSSVRAPSVLRATPSAPVFSANRSSWGRNKSSKSESRRTDADAVSSFLPKQLAGNDRVGSTLPVPQQTSSARDHSISPVPASSVEKVVADKEASSQPPVLLEATVAEAQVLVQPPTSEQLPVPAQTKELPVQPSPAVQLPVPVPAPAACQQQGAQPSSPSSSSACSEQAIPTSAAADEATPSTPPSILGGSASTDSRDSSCGQHVLDVTAAPWTPSSSLTHSCSTASKPNRCTSPSSSPTSSASIASRHDTFHAVVRMARPPATSGTMSGSTAMTRRCPSKHNSVVIKADSMVKDAAGAITKVLDRILHMFVAAIKLDQSHESLNRAVKAMAVARKYVKDSDASQELTFLPVNRSNHDGVEDPDLFGFLVFKTNAAGSLLQHHDADVNVSRSSDPMAIASAVIRITLERGQLVMKAGGASAMYVAMSSVIYARQCLKRFYHVDVMLVPTWVTSNTVSTLGRESKFLQFNLIKCHPNGPIMDATVHPSQGSYEGPLTHSMA